MGASKSKIDTNVVNNVMNEMIMSSIVKNTNITKSFSTVGQNSTIKIGGDVECTSGDVGGFINQNISADSNMLVTLSSTDVNDVKNDLLNKMASDNTSYNEIIQGFLSGIGQVSNQETITTVKNDISNIINQEFTTENVNENINAVSVSQSGIIEIGGNYTGPCKFVGQDAVIQMQLSNITTNIAKKIVENSSLTDVSTKTTSTSTLEQKGFSTGMLALIAIIAIGVMGFPVIAGFAVGGKGMLIALVVGIICVLAFIGIFYSMNDRAPWEESCQEKCKDTCPSNETDCIECSTCEQPEDAPSGIRALHPRYI